MFQSTLRVVGLPDLVIFIIIPTYICAYIHIMQYVSLYVLLDFEKLINNEYLVGVGYRNNGLKINERKVACKWPVGK